MALIRRFVQCRRVKLGAATSSRMQRVLASVMGMYRTRIGEMNGFVGGRKVPLPSMASSGPGSGPGSIPLNIGLASSRVTGNITFGLIAYSRTYTGKRTSTVHGSLNLV